MKLQDHKNPGKQGDAGMGVAIGWFASNGWTVCVPLTDSQEYDLVVENGKGLKTVQVKTSRCLNRAGNPRVELRTKSGMYRKVKCLDMRLDYLFIVTDDAKYLIPRKAIEAQVELILGKRYDRYRVGS
jgi:hypothetical protein